MPYRKPSSNRRPLISSEIAQQTALCAVAIGLMLFIPWVDESQKQNAYHALWAVIGVLVPTAASTLARIGRHR